MGTCLYIFDRKSQGVQLVNIEYTNSTTLMATKLTGGVYVPSGKPNFRLDLSSRKLEFNIAGTGYKHPYWAKDHSLKSTSVNAINLKKHRIREPVIHISQFRPIIL